MLLLTQGLGIHFTLAGNDKSLPSFTLPQKYPYSLSGAMLVLLSSCTSLFAGCCSKSIPLSILNVLPQIQAHMISYFYCKTVFYIANKLNNCYNDAPEDLSSCHFWSGSGRQHGCSFLTGPNKRTIATL